MNCGRIRYLISLEADGRLSPVQVEHIHAHLAHCHNCRSFHDQIAATVDSLAQHSSQPAALSHTFASTLHQQLQADGARLDNTPIERMRAWLNSTLSPVDGILTRPIRLTLACIAAWLALTALVATLLSPPRALPAEVTTGHLAAFSVQRTADGRIYARLTTRTTSPRPYLQEPPQ